MSPPLLLVFLPLTTAHVLVPTNETHWWRPPPPGRGTASILVTSFITLTLCVWTSIHLGLSQRTSAVPRVLKKLSWMVTGLLVPELVLFRALSEFKSARALHADWCNHFDIKKGSSKDKLGLAGAFFAGMGGLVLGERDEFGGFPAVLTARGFVRVIEMGHVPRNAVKKRQIVDKGKSDILGKGLVCGQALYMAVACLLRWTNGLTVTLLELHVVLHVLSTIVTYGFWWSKPQDVAEPIAVVKERDLAALLSVVYGRHTSTGILVTRYDGKRRGFTGLAAGKDFGTATVLCEQNTVRFHGRVRKDTGSLVGKVRDVFPGESLFIGEQLQVRYLLPAPSSTTAKLDDKDLNTLQLAAAALRTLKYTTHEAALADPARAEVLVKRKGEQYTRATAGNTTLQTATELGLLLIPMLYGASHAVAWDSNFPSEKEQYFWRMSSVVIMVGPAVIWLLAFIGRIKGWLLVVVCAPVAAVMVVARGFLTVEAFLSLRSLPEEAYQSTPWEDLWPHW